MHGIKETYITSNKTLLWSMAVEPHYVSENMNSLILPYLSSHVIEHYNPS